MQWVNEWNVWWRKWEGVALQSISDTWSGVIPSVILNYEQYDPGSLTVISPPSQASSYAVFYLCE